MTTCVCDADVHVQGCPRYTGEDMVLLANTSDTTDTSDTNVADTEAATNGESAAGNETATEEGSRNEDIVVDDGTDETDSDSDSDDTGDSGDKAVSSSEEESGESGSSTSDAATVDRNSTSSSDAVQTEQQSSEPEMEPLDMEIPEDLDAVEEDWEYPSGWSGYGEGQMEGNLLAAVEFLSLENELDEHIEEIQGVLTNDGNAQLVDDGGSFGDVLAVYAVLSGQTDDYPYGVSLDDDKNIELLQSVYWSMTQVTGVSNTDGVTVSVRHLTAEEAANLYELDEEEVQSVIDLTEQNDTVDTIVDESIFASLTSEEFEEVLALVSDDIPANRRSVLLAGVSLVGKVDYFWGGKSLAYGWDDRWGEMRVVSSPGNSTYGTALPLGLDCSGFVSWAFLNAYGTDGTVGNGATDQLYHCATVDWNDAEPGDLVFYYDPSSGSVNHVGIVLTVDESGPETVVHCTTGGVQISGAEGFSYVGRPAVYS